MAERRLSYDAVGATRPADDDWTEHPPGLRRYERTVPIGHGQEQWDEAAYAVLGWAVKTRSGFTVESVPAGTPLARLGTDYRLTAALGPFTLREPVRVVAVVDEPRRVRLRLRHCRGAPCLRRGGVRRPPRRRARRVVHPALADPPGARGVASGLPRRTPRATVLPAALSARPE